MSDGGNAIESFSHESASYLPTAEFSSQALIKTQAEYERLYKESIDSPETFWERETSDLVFRKKWSTLFDWQLPFAKWFVGSELNITESCLDRHLQTDRKHKRAIIWEGEPGETVEYT